jgi:hypothetical protein
MSPGFNDKISSILIQGRARVTVYNDDRFRGFSLTVDHDVEDLSHHCKQGHPRRGWNDRISSIRVDLVSRLLLNTLHPWRKKGGFERLFVIAGVALYKVLFIVREIVYGEN